MSVIYMTHPVHGAKVAISNHEAEYDEMHGWSRFDPTEPAVADVAEDEKKDEEKVEAVNEMAEPKRRGRRRAAPEN
jgi:hypothetical protein